MTCIETMTCFPTNPLDVFKFYEYQYGIPTIVILALFVGMIIMAIYLHTRSLAHLAVMSIYSLSVFGAMFLNNTYLEQQYHMAIYIIMVVVASVIVMLVLKLVKE